MLAAFGLLLPAAEAGENTATVTLAYPVNRAPGPITLDGKITEAEWGPAIKASGFTASGSDELAPEQIVMRLLYDDAHLYMAVRCSESRMAHLVVENLVDDGPLWHDDCIEIFLDANHDHGTYWQFITTPAAKRYDALGFDNSWNCPWRVAVAREKDAWTVELAMPFRGLAVPAPAPGAVWGFNLVRERRAGGKTQLYDWANVERVFHNPGRFGHLWFLAPDWQPHPKRVAALAGQIEGKEARLFTADGFWSVRRGRAPRLWSYRELLQAQQLTLSRFLGDLRALYDQRPKLAFRDRFTKLDNRFRAVQKLASGSGKVDALACASAQTFLNSLEDNLRDLYYRVQIELLDEEY
jgi:cellulose/xylan binding protein with CBM9 domain